MGNVSFFVSGERFAVLGRLVLWLGVFAWVQRKQVGRGKRELSADVEKRMITERLVGSRDLMPRFSVLQLVMLSLQIYCNQLWA